MSKPPGADQNQTRSAAIPRSGLKNSQGCGSRLLRRMRARKSIRLEITEEQFQGFVPQPIDRVHISVFTVSLVENTKRSNTYAV